MRKLPVVAFADIDVVPLPAGEARGALARVLETLACERIMLVFCSRRTRAQVESARQAFGVFHPFITESGGAVFVPERYFGADFERVRKVGGYQAIEFASHYELVAETVRRSADRLNIGVLGFNDMSVEQVARECGFSLLDARLAKLREYGEPFRLLCANPIAERRLFRLLESAGLTCTRGDDFHLATSARGPMDGIALLTTQYRAAFGSVITAAAVEGVGASDLAPHVGVVLDPISVEPGDPQAGIRWLETIIHECDSVRAAHTTVRAAGAAG